MNPYVTSPRIYNVTLTAADTEYSQAIPAGVSRIRVKPRQNAKIKLSFRPGHSDDEYVTVEAAPAPPYEVDCFTGQVTLYMQSTVAGTVAEIEAWS